MNFKIAFALVFCMFSFLAQSQDLTWTRLQEDPKGINRLIATSQNVAFAATNNGRILRSTDGVIWSDAYVNIMSSQSQTYINDRPIHSVFALTDQKIYFTTNGSNIIEVSEDAGNSWTQVIWVDYPGILTLYDIHFIDEDVAFVAGIPGFPENTTGEGVLLKSTNASAELFESDWEELQTGTNEPIHRIVFVNQNRGYCLTESGIVIVTIDGGNSWGVLNTNGNTIYDLAQQGETLWVVGENGFVAEVNTDNSVVEEVSLGTTNTMRSVYFADANNGWIAGDGGVVWQTSNAGNDWTVLANPGVGHVTKIAGFSNGTAFLFGQDHTIMRTEDNGASWSLSYGEFANFNNASFANDDLGWAGADSGIIYKTTDGGYTWSAFATPVTSDIQSVFFINENDGFACAWTGWQSTGSLLKTSDGGTTWSVQPDVTGRLADVFFLDSTFGWIAVDDGRVFKTEDGGDTWSLAANEGLFHSKIFFTDQLNGWLVGSNGAVRKSSNGGTNWEVIDGGFEITHFNGIYFINQQNGWICGNQRIFGTTDGGETWSTLWSESWGVGSSIFNDIFFEDPQSGWAMGYYGTPTRARIVHTNDGGQTWDDEFYLSNAPVTTITQRSPNGLVALGHDGLVLSYEMETPGNVSITNTPFDVVKLFPNPAASTTTLEIDLSEACYLEILIYDYMGRVQMQNEVVSCHAGLQQIQLSVEQLNPGVYVVWLKANNRATSLPLIIRK